MTTLLDLLAKIGLLIGLFFSVLPIPILVRAVTRKNQNELKQLSLPGTIMGFTCTSIIFSFCSLKGLEDCVTSTYMGFVSGGLTLLTIYALKNDLRTLAVIMAIEISLMYGVSQVFSDELTNTLTLIINTLACVVMPLDTLEKVLRTKNLEYVNYLMHGLGVVNGVIWTLYHYFNNVPSLALANSLGIVCEGFVLIACLYATGYFHSLSHPAVQLASKVADYFFIKPRELINSILNSRGKIAMKAD